MYRSKQLLTLPVISLNDGEELGKVQGVIIDPESISLAALVLDYRKGFSKEPRIIPFEHITSFGNYAVTIKDSGSCERVSQSSHLGSLFMRPTRILGAKVLTEDGNLLGTVEEFSFDPASGKINGLELSDNLLNTLVHGKSVIEGNVITTIGKNAVIVQSGTKAFIKEESHFTEKAKSIKETSQKVWEQTRETTKKISESLYKSVEKFTAEDDLQPKDNLTTNIPSSPPQKPDKDE